jgi:hypothetical protein
MTRSPFLDRRSLKGQRLVGHHRAAAVNDLFVRHAQGLGDLRHRRRPCGEVRGQRQEPPDERLAIERVAPGRVARE